MTMLWDELTEEQKVLCAPRRRLDDRRHHDIVEVMHVWSPATPEQIVEPLLLSIGRYEDGRVGEVFIDGLEAGKGKVSSRTTALRSDVATLISIALQYGAPIDVLRGAMSRSDVNVMGKVRMMPHTIIGTVLDALAGEVLD
jgi:hypothetical protein